MAAAGLVSALRWLISVLVLFGAATPFYALWLAWRCVSLALPRSAYIAGDDCLYALYQQMVLFFFEHGANTRVVLYGDVDAVLKYKERVILMSNHQCTVDWLVADMLAERQGSVGHIRYILKDSLKYLPLYGHYFRQHSCIYVKRSGKFQQDSAQQQLDELARSNAPFWMVVFPEGTRHNPAKPHIIDKARNYALQHNLPVYTHLLTPRPKALHLCVERLRERTDALYDITIAYSCTRTPRTDTPPTDTSHQATRTPAPSLTRFLWEGGHEVHIHLQRIPISEVPSDPSAFELWLYERFVAKDRLLGCFYSPADMQRDGRLGEGGRCFPLPLRATLLALLVWLCVLLPLCVTAWGRLAYLALCLTSLLSSLAWALTQP